MPKQLSNLEYRAFWYKGIGITQFGNTKHWVGSVEAKRIDGALSTVKIRSCLWNAQEIQSIAIYEIDDDGTIDEQPSLWMNYSGESLFPDDIPWKTQDYVALPAPAKKVDVTANFETADWLTEMEIPTQFTTVNFKD